MSVQHSQNIALNNNSTRKEDEVGIINGCKNIHEKTEVKRLVTFFCWLLLRWYYGIIKSSFHASSLSHCVYDMGKLVRKKEIHKKGFPPRTHCDELTAVVVWGIFQHKKKPPHIWPQFWPVIKINGYQIKSTFEYGNKVK